MNRTALTLAAAFALAAVAGVARADDHEGRRGPDRGERTWPIPAPAHAPPVRAPQVWASPAPAPVRSARFDGERVRERRDAYGRLDLARDRFHATWHTPRQRDRFEAWYAARRAELDHRWAELDRGRW